ncbi:hypothetical protein OAF63_07330 [Saprospiraceae bacterium]|jgi:hypothetical protein|nr:hypothetical protein [Bacteroidota bacterium]MDB4728589.1 hypothetical protein [Saprospiraceae bacterium]MDF1864730.1 hypothetical protein [Saprospiraceae bacterium]
MTKETSNFDSKQGIWIALFWVMPAVLLPEFGEYISNDVPKLAMSAILGGLGGGFGALVYYLIKNKSKKLEILILSIFAFVMIGSLVFMDRKETIRSTLSATCPVCGYQSLEKLGDPCGICLVEFNENFKIAEGYSSLEEMLHSEQTFFFSLEESFTFLKPDYVLEEGEKYLKDANWKSQVEQSAIDSIQQLLEFKTEGNKVNIEMH